jgi:hypothetical protein
MRSVDAGFSWVTACVAAPGATVDAVAAACPVVAVETDAVAAAELVAAVVKGGTSV